MPVNPIRSIKLPRRRRRDLDQLLQLADDVRRSRSVPDLYAQRIELFCGIARVDESLLAHADQVTSHAPPLAVRRKPIKQGLGSIWVSEITLPTSDGSQLKLMEKAVDAAGPEAMFWASAKSNGFQLAGNSYTSVAPLLSIAAGPVTILYLPYLGHIRRPKLGAKQNFQSHTDVLARAAAEFNRSNFLSAAHDSPTQRRIRLGRKSVPSIELIQNELELSSPHASRLLRDVCRDVHARWDELQAMYDSVPVCLCHNDIGPGNAIIDNEHVHLLDFEKAGPAPVGSDMHTILRWGGDSLLDEKEAERLIAKYAKHVQLIRPEITLEQIRLGAWVTFFIRYSAIAKWPSARNLDSFSLALVKARELLETVS